MNTAQKDRSTGVSEQERSSPDAETVDITEITDYLRTVPLSTLSWVESRLFEEGGDLDEPSKRMGVFTGEMRREFFDKEESEFLNLIGTFSGRDPLSVHTMQGILIKIIYEEMMEHRQRSYWFRIAATSDLSQLYPLYRILRVCTWDLRHHRDLLPYLLSQEDPMQVFRTLIEVSNAHCEKTSDPEKMSDTEFHKLVNSVIAGFIRALRLADVSDGTYEGLPPEVTLRLISPIFQEPSKPPRRILLNGVRSPLNPLLPPGARDAE